MSRHRLRRLAGLIYFPFDKLRSFALAKPLLPIVKKRVPKPTPTAKRGNSRTGPTLLRCQTTLSHPTRLLPLTAEHKMGFTMRSQNKHSKSGSSRPSAHLRKTLSGIWRGSWNRTNSCWRTFRFRRPSDILTASSGFDQRSIIESESSRALNWPVARTET